MQAPEVFRISYQIIIIEMYHTIRGSSAIKRIVLLDFIYRLVSQKNKQN
jgi:hypothetical protein